jgi:hypothetical protein
VVIFVTVMMFFVAVIIMMTEIHAYIEPVVIPFCLMVLTPLPGFIHSVDVGIDLATVFAISADVTIDSVTIRFKPAMTILFPILVGSSRATESQNKSAR